MKFSLQCSLLLITALSACNASSTGPEDTAKKFFEAASTGNPEATKLFISESNPALMMLGSQTYVGPAQAGKMAVDRYGAIVKIVPKVQAEQGDNAIVDLSVTYKDGFTGQIPIPLQRVNGQWYYAPPQNNMGL